MIGLKVSSIFLNLYETMGGNETTYLLTINKKRISLIRERRLGN